MSLSVRDIVLIQNIHAHDFRKAVKGRPFLILQVFKDSFVAVACTTTKQKGILPRLNYRRLRNKTESHDEGFRESQIDLSVCVKIPKRPPYYYPGAKVLTRATPELFGKIQSLVKVKYRFPYAAEFHEPLFAELRAMPEPGNVVSVNITIPGLANIAPESHGLKRFYVIGHGKDFGLPHSLICCPYDRFFESAEHRRRNQSTAMLHLERAVALPATCLYFPSGDAHENKQPVEILWHERPGGFIDINTGELDRYLATLGPYRALPGHRPPGPVLR